MAKKPLSKAAQRFDAALDRWRDRLWLKQWDVSVKLKDQKLPGGAAAEIVARPPYKDIYIMVDNVWLEGANPNEIEDVVCHEMVHAVLSPLKDVAAGMAKKMPAQQRSAFVLWLDKENEAVTTHLEQILRREARWPKR